MYIQPRSRITPRSTVDGPSSTFIIIIVMVVVAVAAVPLLLAFRAWTAERRIRAEQESKCRLEREDHALALSIDALERQHAGIPHRGEVYTIEGPNQEIHLAYRQDLPQRVLTVQNQWSSEPAPEMPEDLAAIPGNPSDANGDSGPSPTPPPEQPAVHVSQQEIQHLQSPTTTPPRPAISQVKDPFNPPSIAMASSGRHTPPLIVTIAHDNTAEDPPQERALRTQLEVLRAEVERLQAENNVLAMGGTSPSAPPAYQPE